MRSDDTSGHSPVIKQMVVEINGVRQVLQPVEDTPDRSPMSDRQRRALFAAADSIELSREERLGFAEQLLEREVQSWKYLSAHEASRLMDAINGYILVAHLMDVRDPS